MSLSSSARQERAISILCKYGLSEPKTEVSQKVLLIDETEGDENSGLPLGVCAPVFY